jgi:hypothetical protein
LSRDLGYEVRTQHIIVRDRDDQIRVQQLTRTEGVLRSEPTSDRLFAWGLTVLLVAVVRLVAMPAYATTATRLSCPAHALHSLPRHQRAAVRESMVPAHPQRVLACRYHGLNQLESPGTLASSKTLAISDTMSAFSDARVISPRGAQPSCPADFGEQFVLVFGYPDGTRLRVTVQAQGCGYATNGARTVLTPPLLSDQLRVALGHDTA